MNNEINYIVENLPNSPGIYQFLDTNKNIIYVGKAKRLKSRVKSYFIKNHISGKTKVMVNKITDINYILVDNESDALLLENSFIKKYKPKYNIQLKDDKTYPWICIKNEKFPRVYFTRNIREDGSKYFGPYTSTHIIRTLLDLISSIFPLRKCNRDLTEKNIKSKKYNTACLEYHIGKCAAPCIEMQSESEYNKNIDKIIEIIKGNLADVNKHLQKEMQKYASNLDFEKAQIFKDKIQLLEKFQAKSVIVSSKLDDCDVFSYIKENSNVYINYLKIIKGAIVQSHNISFKINIDDEDENILSFIINDIRNKLFSKAKTTIVPFKPSFHINETKFIVPKIGDKLKLLELSERNAKSYKMQSVTKLLSANYGKGKWKVLEELQKDLDLKTIPVKIECFDNSNTQGTNPVSACVVFKNGKPAKSEYRIYKIKTVEGPNDFASMEEVIFRRYKRLLEENVSLPDLIVIDGGKGQLNASCNSLNKLNINIPIISIAKKLEEIYKPNDPVALMLDKRSESLKLIQKLRDEAHRFSLKFHRDLRSKENISLEINKINGIGKKTTELLYKRFGTLKNISHQDKDEVIKLIGKKRTEILFAYLTV